MGPWSRLLPVATIQSCFSFLCSWLHSPTFLALSSFLLVVWGCVEVFAFAEFSELRWCWAVTEGAAWGGWEKGLGKGGEEEVGWEKQSWLFNCGNLNCPRRWVCTKPAEWICHRDMGRRQSPRVSHCGLVPQHPDSPTTVVQSPSSDSGALLPLGPLCGQCCPTMAKALDLYGNRPLSPYILEQCLALSWLAVKAKATAAFRFNFVCLGNMCVSAFSDPLPSENITPQHFWNWFRYF